MTVNDAGDRILASYEIIKVIAGPSGSEWKKVAQIRMWPYTNREEIIPYA
jgi:hypothetical protein